MPVTIHALKRWAISLMVGMAIGLSAAGLILYINKETPPTVHFHANFAVYLNDQKVDLSADKYMEPVEFCSVTKNQTPQERVHMHSGVGDVIHVHSSNVTWGDFFANIGWSLGSTFIATDSGQLYQNDTTHTVHYLINGLSTDNPTDTYIKSTDRLLVYYGSATPYALQAIFKKVPTTASYNNNHKDPATCSGS